MKGICKMKKRIVIFCLIVSIMSCLTTGIISYLFTGCINMVLGFIGIGILAGIILSVLTSSSFSAKVSKPINDLTKAASMIAYGDLSKRVDTSAEGEIGLLENAINHMATILEQNINSLQNTNSKISKILDGIPDGVFAINKYLKVIYCNNAAISLFQLTGTNETLVNKSFLELVRNPTINQMISHSLEKNQVLTEDVYISNITDSIYKVWVSTINTSNASDTQATEIIVVINDITKFKKLEKIKTEFVSNVSHELKTPLTSIRGFVETLKNGAIKDPVIAMNFLDIIEIESERLTALINDILDLSEIESGKVDTTSFEFSFKDTLLECVLILQEKAELKNINFEINIEYNIIVKANPNRVKQICINLIDNAIKYNKENGKISISAVKKGSILQFCVKDSGIGISEYDQSRVFERFYRVDKGRSRSMGGTGLGLSIVKHIVNLYQGDIEVNSIPNIGTEFVVLLPIC